MGGEPRHRLSIDIAPAAIAKVIAAVALVWLWLHIWQLVLVLLVAVVVAIGLDPVVTWAQARGLSRALASVAVVTLLALIIGGFFWITGASLASQARQLGGRLQQVQQTVMERTPDFVKRGMQRNGGSADAAAATYAVAAGKLAVLGIAVTGLVLILAAYLLIEGRRTYVWLAAYAPRGARERVHITAREARTAILAYAIGNAATSLFAAVVVLVALSLLHVPAALLLALLAGVFDFVPVLGFFCAAFPAVLLAATRSAGVALAVAAIYAAYHAAENYYIAPRVYGDRLKLSNLAVILAFAVGAEIGGVGGALLALPIAALYPVVERVWLENYLNREAVETHQRMQRKSAH